MSIKAVFKNCKNLGYRAQRLGSRGGAKLDRAKTTKNKGKL